MDHFPFPATRAASSDHDLFKRRGEGGPSNLVRDPPDRLLARPSVLLLGAAVPENDHVAHIADENSVVCQVKQIGSFAKFIFNPFALGDLNLQPLIDPAQLESPLLNSCFQFVSHPFERLFSPPSLDTYPTCQNRRQ